MNYTYKMDKKMEINLTDEEYQIIKDEAKSLGVTEDEMIRILIFCAYQLRNRQRAAEKFNKRFEEKLREAIRQILKEISL